MIEVNTPTAKHVIDCLEIGYALFIEFQITPTHRSHLKQSNHAISRYTQMLGSDNAAVIVNATVLPEAKAVFINLDLHPKCGQVLVEKQ